MKNESEFLTICRELHPETVKIALYYTRDLDRAQQVASDVWVKFSKVYDDPRTRNAINTNPGYRRTAVRNAFFDAYRAEKRWAEREVCWDPDKIAELQLSDPEWLENQVRNGLDAQLGHALAKLGEEEFQIIILRYYEDMKPREIAEEMSIPAARVHRVHYAALRKLRTYLEESNEVA
ncbi:RNA polymerase sigma factor [Streptodolium elevatio]|uniref:RNA polymerase sigma factor n=1 Tax=Streptodolium elevatio TaxID=3157996 RepID=A0ABV3DH30_9ACTN